MTGTLEQANGILKIVTGKFTRNYSTRPTLFNRANKGAGEKLGDRGFEIPTEIEGNWAHTWMTESGDYPAGRSVKTIRPTVFTKEYKHSVRLSMRAIETIKPGKTAVKDWYKENVDGSVAAAYKMNNIYAWGTGNGVIGTISSGAASATQTLNNSNNVRYLRNGMLIEIWSSDYVTSRGTARITSFPTPGTTTITLSASLTSTTTDVVTIAGGANNAITGMDTIVDNVTDGPVIFQNTDRNEFLNYRGQVIDVDGAGIDTEILQRMIGAKLEVALGGRGMGDEEGDNGFDYDGYELVSYMSQRDAYIGLGYNLRRFEGKTKSIDLGFTAHEFSGMPWIAEVDCRKDAVYYIDWSKVQKFVDERGWHWVDIDGTIMRLVPSETTGRAFTAQAEGYFGCNWNLGSPDPRALGKVIDLAIPTSY